MMSGRKRGDDADGILGGRTLAYDRHVGCITYRLRDALAEQRVIINYCKPYAVRHDQTPVWID
jgi:hypothetical protein